MKVSIMAKLRNYFIAGVVVLIPIGITIYIQMIKYWMRLFTTENKLVQEAHLDSIERLKERKTSWLITIIYCTPGHMIMAQLACPIFYQTVQ